MQNSMTDDKKMLCHVNNTNDSNGQNEMRRSTTTVEELQRDNDKL